MNKFAKTGESISSCLSASALTGSHKEQLNIETLFFIRLDHIIVYLYLCKINLCSCFTTLKTNAVTHLVIRAIFNDRITGLRRLEEQSTHFVGGVVVETDTSESSHACQRTDGRILTRHVLCRRIQSAHRNTVRSRQDEKLHRIHCIVGGAQRRK